jgi:hypothetical protein
MQSTTNKGGAMKALVKRWPMCGGGTAYDIHVPLNDAKCPKEQTHIILDDGKHYVDFPQAICPVSHYAMDPGWDRWENWKAHEKLARAEMLGILKRVFPETEPLTEWPLLWVGEWTLPRAEIEIEV